MSLIRKAFMNVTKTDNLRNLASFLLNRKCNIYSTNSTYNYLHKYIDNNHIYNLDHYSNGTILKNGKVEAAIPNVYDSNSVTGVNLYKLIITEPIVYKEGDDFDRCLDYKIMRENFIKNAIKNNVIVLYTPEDYGEFICMYESSLFNSIIDYNHMERHFNQKAKEYLKME